MKQWFKDLDKSIQIGIIVGCFIVAGLSVLLFYVVGTENPIRYLFSVLLLIGLVFGIVFSVWMKDEPQKKENTQATISNNNLKTETSSGPKTVFDEVKVNNGGKIQMYPGYMKIQDPNGCLIAKGGKTYHTNVGCYLNWTEEAQKEFLKDGWETRPKAEMEAQGFRKCKFCIENDMTEEEIIQRMLDNGDDLTFTATRTSSEHSQDIISTLSENDKLIVEYDEDKDVYHLLADSMDEEPFASIPNKIIEQLKFNNPEQAYVFVKEITEDDEGNQKLICYIDQYHHSF